RPTARRACRAADADQVGFVARRRRFNAGVRRRKVDDGLSLSVQFVLSLALMYRPIRRQSVLVNPIHHAARQALPAPSRRSASPLRVSNALSNVLSFVQSVKERAW